MGLAFLWLFLGKYVKIDKIMCFGNHLAVISIFRNSLWKFLNLVIRVPNPIFSYLLWLIYDAWMSQIQYYDAENMICLPVC